MVPGRVSVIRFLDAKRLKGTAMNIAKVVAIKARKRVSTILSNVRRKVSLTCKDPSGQLTMAFTICRFPRALGGTVMSFWNLPVESVLNFPRGNSCYISLTQNNAPSEFDFKWSPNIVNRSPICPELWDKTSWRFSFEPDEVWLLFESAFRKNSISVVWIFFSRENKSGCVSSLTRGFTKWKSRNKSPKLISVTLQP